MSLQIKEAQMHTWIKHRSLIQHVIFEILEYKLKREDTKKFLKDKLPLYHNHMTLLNNSDS